MWKDAQLEYSFGGSVRKSKRKEIRSPAEIQEKFVSTPWQDHNICMLASASKLWDTTQGKAIEFGNLIHEMMAQVDTKNDVAKVVNAYVQNGMINNEESILIHKSIDEIVHHSELQHYFSEDATIFNEREIVDIDNQTLIPDRLVFNQNNEVVIIDYKTGKPASSHQQQLVRYERVLMAMNFNVHKKLLVYIDKEILVEAF